MRANRGQKLVQSPGDILLVALTRKGWDQKTLARIMGRPAQMVNEVVKDKKAITSETAHQLEAAGLGPAYRWMSAQALWDLLDVPEGLADVRRRARAARR